MYSQKKKKFTYGTVVSRPFKQPSRSTDTVEFPDDFNSLSQNSKRQKMDTTVKTKIDEKKIEREDTNSRIEDKKTDKVKSEDKIKKDVCSDALVPIEDDNDLIPPEDFMGDDFDFTQAADEIDQIEIAASQMVSVKPIAKQPVTTTMKENQDPDILEELLSGKSQKSSQKGVDDKFYLKLPKKKPLPNHYLKAGECSVTSEKNIMPKPFPEKRNFDTMQNTSPGDFQIEDFEKRQKEIKIKKENDNIELLNTYKTKMLEAEQKYLSKDGEIRILRDTLRKLSEDERKYKERIQGLEHDLKTQQSDKEAKLLSEVEKLQTQLTFKEKEVQDVLEKQKKNSTPSKSIPSHKKSPKVGFYSDAFEKSEKYEKVSMRSSKHISISKISSFQSKILVGKLARNMRDLSPSKNSDGNSGLPVDLFDGLNLNCKHLNDDIDEKEKVTDSYCNLQSLLELVSIDDFFLPELVTKVNNYLNSLVILLGTENECTSSNEAPKTENKNSPHRKSECENSPTRECEICKNIYINGLCGLMLLCNASRLIKEYLLNGLVKYLGKEVKTLPAIDNSVKIDQKKYYKKYLNSSEFLLVRDKTNVVTTIETSHAHHQYDCAVQFWRTLGELTILHNYETVERELFIFHISLQLYPLHNSSEIHCMYLIEHQLLPKHLNMMTFGRILHVIEMLQKFIGLKSVTNLMCNISERCPLLLIYNWLINEDLTKDKNIIKVFQELVSFLSSLIAFDQNLAYSCVLESECRCSNEIIEFLITFLFDEFKYFQQEIFLPIKGELKSRILSRLTCFRQGMSLLCLLCCNEKNLCDKRSAVEWNYIYLLVGTIKMYRKIPSVNDKEVLDLEDLLDMDQYIDIDVPSEKMEADPAVSKNSEIVVID